MKKKDDLGVSEAILAACQVEMGVLKSSFLCQSVSALGLTESLTVREQCSVEDVIKLLKSNKKGCVAIVNASNQVLGIFTERDCLLKVMLSSIDIKNTPISELMTRDPVLERPDTTMAYALNLMSVGGFRHLPIVDENNVIIAILSVKDLVDFIVEQMHQDLLKFETV